MSGTPPTPGETGLAARAVFGAPFPGLTELGPQGPRATAAPDGTAHVVIQRVNWGGPPASPDVQRFAFPVWGRELWVPGTSSIGTSPTPADIPGIMAALQQ